MRKGFDTKSSSKFGATYHKIRDVVMKGQALKATQDFSFQSLAKSRELFSKVSDIFKSSFRGVDNIPSTRD